jgi:hypothetical protein
MDLPQDQIDELKKIAPDLSAAEEGGFTYLLLRNVVMPEGCIPQHCDLLLCPVAKDGYESRLYFASQIVGCADRNWNGNLRVLERNWFAFSWKVQPGLRLAPMLIIHLNGLRK